jgi:gliding motility-associated lipoprotein GldD
MGACFMEQLHLFIFTPMIRYLLPVLLLLSIASCRPEVYHPKPTGYFRIDTPATHKYQLFDKPGFPYSFEYPANGIIQQDTIFDKHQQDNRFWINIYVPGLEGIINITYKEISKELPFYKLMDDAWGLSYFHHEKADYIDTKTMQNDQGSVCFLYTVGGNSASRYQFAASDSVQHFLRGSLYFDVTPNADSLKPVTDFMVQDMKHLLMTLKWK